MEQNDELVRARLRIAELEGKRSTTLSGVQFIVLLCFFPMVIAFIVLGVRIVWAASSNPETLTNMEGLLVGLAVFGNPVSAGMGMVMGAFSEEIKAKITGNGSK